MVSDVNLHPYIVVGLPERDEEGGMFSSFGMFSSSEPKRMVRRCKLDPNLKAPGFKGST